MKKTSLGIASAWERIAFLLWMAEVHFAKNCSISVGVALIIWPMACLSCSNLLVFV